MTDPTPPRTLATMSAAETEAWRARQKSRNRVMGLVMGGLAILFFAITIVKLGAATQGAG